MKYLAVFLLLCGPAFGQTCANREQITANLATKFGEHHIAGGLQSATQMIEVWSSPETGSFTILLTRPNGISCIMSSGKYWDSFDPKPEGVLQ